MRVARWIILSFLILAIVFTYSPFSRGEIDQFWIQARPGVLQFLDGLYATIRNLVAGGELPGGIQEDAPNIDYDLIITRESKGHSTI